MPPPTDHYRVLQVHPEAEQEVIEAAYRRLMRKYHPDVLEPEQRQDPEMLRRAQEINEAYHVLSDAQRRAHYDALLRSSKAHSSPEPSKTTPAATQLPVEVEKRMYPARCTCTRQSFQILMARRKGNTGPFRVVGLSPLEMSEPVVPPAPDEQNSLFGRLFRKIRGQRPVHRHPFDAGLPSDQELEEMFDESRALDFGDIDWAGFKCPFCEGEFVHPDGTLSTWTVCGKCSRVSCAGGITKTPVGGLTTCPWCGSKRPITYHVPVGKKAQKSVRGIIGHSQTTDQPGKPVLPQTQAEKQLPPAKGEEVKQG